jgi:hypothetical protein
MNSHTTLLTVSVDIISEIIGYLTATNIIYLHRIGNQRLWKNILSSLDNAQYGMVCTEKLVKYLTEISEDMSILTNDLTCNIMSKVKYFSINYKNIGYEYPLRDLFNQIVEHQRGKMFLRNVDLTNFCYTTQLILPTTIGLDSIVTLTLSLIESLHSITLPPNLVNLFLIGSIYSHLTEINIETFPESIEKLDLINCLVPLKILTRFLNLRILCLSNTFIYDTVLPDKKYAQVGNLCLPKLTICAYGHHSLCTYLNNPENTLYFKNPKIQYSYNREKNLSNLMNNSSSLKELFIDGPSSEYIIESFSDEICHFGSLSYLDINFESRTKIDTSVSWNLPSVTYLSIYRTMVGDKNLQNLHKLEVLRLRETEPIQSDDPNDLLFSGTCLERLFNLKVLGIKFDINGRKQLIQNILDVNIQSVWFYIDSFNSETIHWLKQQFKKFFYKEKTFPKKFITFSSRKYNRYKIMHKNKSKFDTLFAKTKAEFLQKYNIKLHAENYNKS